MEHSSPGDPSGRRLARGRAAKLAEAGTLAHALEALLRDAEFDASSLAELTHALAQQEQAELQKSYGRIESRKRFKHASGHPLSQGRGCNELFIDECGRSNPEPHLSDPVFALAGVAMDSEHVASYVARADVLKLRFFGTTAHTFHEPLMRNFDGPYHFGDSLATRRAFDEAIDTLIADTPFTAFGVAIRKSAFERAFLEQQADPYLPVDVYSMAIMMLLERYVDYISVVNPSRRGRVTFEAQGPKEDALHQLEFARLQLWGTQWVPSSAFQQAIEPGARFVPKAGSDPTELADMLSRELWEWVRGGCQSVPKRWNLFGEKIFRRGTRRMGTFGVKIFPDSDLRDIIESHRDQL